MRVGQVILVDDGDTPIGAAEKLAAHRHGRLHRAFSVLLFGQPGVLLQRRAEAKYHSPFLWSNACCGHPEPGEATDIAAHRRLREEMGLSSRLREVLRLQYRLELPGGLIEHELNHLFVGWVSEAPQPDPAEVADWRWAHPESLHQDLSQRASAYTPWLPLVWSAVVRWSAQPEPFGFEPGIRETVRSLATLKPEIS